ncbi:hypothetical protein [Natronobacterium texcoconense]|uniref:DUF8027 domain-containing protein n=1 Tax=Natronobacterium texcoconense TaxID=1095778 RepID=A0A1H0Z3L9_NATTX|nr:hypothetical protein [Natronobacterium texcoconense]SDQ21988.1 hypothetical protein SAMN04489842_0118 [Natronobacterium texcoconense]
MPVSGYDPEDIDDALEGKLEDDRLDEYLSESDREAYRAGEANLVDLLESDEISEIVGDEDVSGESGD